MRRRDFTWLLPLIILSTAGLACGQPSFPVQTLPVPVTEAPPIETESPAIPPGAEVADVIGVIDGDTIDVRIDGVEYRVRYIGINTPERDEACYEEASAANAALVERQQLILVRDTSETDQYGRLLRYVYAGDLFVNAELVAEGWAEARRYPPDTYYADYLNELEQDARAGNLGCWPSGVFN